MYKMDTHPHMSGRNRGLPEMKVLGDQKTKQSVQKKAVRLRAWLNWLYF